MSAQPPSQRTDPTGVAYGLSAYLVWGVVVLFWPLLGHVPALEVLAQRVVWALVVLVLCLMVFRVPWTWLGSVRAEWQRLTIAAVIIAVNWLTFIWSVNEGYVAEASLGYFLNPLVNVAVGMILFRERPGWVAVAGVVAAAVGVTVVASAMAATVWVSLVLAFTFSAYGVAKRGVRLPALPGLAFESAVLLPVALAYLAVAGSGAFTSDARTAALLVASGAVTVTPLYLFAQAAPRLPFGLLGMLQYIAPSTMLLIGIFHLGQQVPPAYWAGVSLVWVGFVMFMVTALRRSRRARAS